MADIETLSIKIDTSEAEAAIKIFDRLTEAAERAATAMKKLGETSVVIHRIGEIEEMRIGCDK